MVVSAPAAAAVLGVGRSKVAPKHDGTPPTLLAAEAVLEACSDAEVSPLAIEGFVSYGGESTELLSELAALLGVRRLRVCRARWGGGGGGVGEALGLAARSVAEGEASIVALVRVVGTGERNEAAVPATSWREQHARAAGALDLAHLYALQFNRWAHEHGAGLDAQMAVVLASYRHANRNPLALRAAHRVDKRRYLKAPWVVEPWRLYDCCMRSVGAAAVVLGRAPVGAGAVVVRAYAHEFDTSEDPFSFGHKGAAGAGCQTTAHELWERSATGPGDVDVVQCYDNFSGGVVAALADYGFVRPDEVDKRLTLETLVAPDGELPLNTDGGQLADAYFQGLGQVQEAVRQLRGSSVNQVHGARLALVAGGPFVGATSAAVLERRGLPRARHNGTTNEGTAWSAGPSMPGAAVAGAAIEVQRCEDCATWRWPPGVVCGACGSTMLAGAEVRLQGTVWSAAQVWHVSGPPSGDRRIPYVLVVVELDGAEGVRVLGRAAAGASAWLRVGSRVAGRACPGPDGSSGPVEWDRAGEDGDVLDAGVELRVKEP